MAEQETFDPSGAATSEYRLAPLMAARFLGAYLVLLAVVVFAATALVAVLDLPADLLVVLLAVGVVGMFVLGAWLRSRIVVHLDAAGYRVTIIRSAGTTRAQWNEVEDAISVTRHGAPCLVLRLRSGASTTIPVQTLAGDPEVLVNDVRSRLQVQQKPVRRKRG